MPSPGETEIAVVTSTDLPDLLPLMRAYCHFYAVDPTDAQLERLARALVDDPAHEGMQLLARRDSMGSASPPASGPGRPPMGTGSQ